MALALFFDDRDPVSVHGLACGGGEVAEHLTRKAGAEPFMTGMLEHDPNKDERELRRLRNENWSAFKHATTRDGLDRHDEELLARISDAINDHVLVVGWHDYMLASASLPIEAQMFQIWYFALYPEKVEDHKTLADSANLFGDLRSVDPSEAKRRLRIVIERTRQDVRVMEHPMTDKRPLDFGNV